MIIVMRINFLKNLQPSWILEQQYPLINNDIVIIFKNCASFTDYISEINSTQIDNAKHIDAVILMYNLIEYSENYSKNSGSLWKWYIDEPSLDANGIINNFPVNNDSFKFKQKIIGETRADGTKDFELRYSLNIEVLLENSSNAFN